ncbi:MAG: hypothetical protein IKV49_00210 [Clostridia bacterium]|nr:hypothetical protein [Clostridia bacterium]
MKNTIFQCVTAIICVVAISVTGMLGLNKIADAKIEAAQIAADSAANGTVNGDVSTDAPADDNTATDAPAADDAVTEAPADDAVTEAPADDNAATDAPAADNNAATQAPAADNASKAPSSPAEITAYYNNAINKVISSKAGFKKSRETVMHNLDGGALLKIQLVVDMVNEFLGVGTTQWDNAKGKQDNLSKASLAAGDVKQASCADKNGIYTITMTLKDGNSSANASGNSDTSPLQRAGVFAGKGDKTAYDYKNSENIHTAINGVDDCTAESALEKVTNAKITAVIDSKTGKLQSLTASWDWYVELANVKYTIVGIKQAKGNATTTVKLTNVQW